jgi:hypothetical protein
MVRSLFWRPLRPARPVPVYYLLGGAVAFFLVLASTLTQVYYLTVVDLSPLQMVLVGTVLEATAFLMEIRPASSRTSTAVGSRSSSASP